VALRRNVTQTVGESLVIVVVFRLLTDAGLVGLLLFLSAGTVAWWRAWVLLAVLLGVRLVGAAAVARVNSALLRERARLPLHDTQPWTDRVLLLAVLATGFLGLPLLAGLDVFRWHVLPPPARWLCASGLVLFALGWILKQVALRANAFATTVVRLQSDRAHTVVDAGVYAVVRHPFYAADPLILVGLGLWLQSSAAPLAAVVPVLLMVLRLQLEERFLRRALPGYAAYMTRVPHRLVPGVW
jgi:protein-S-isoprenylcysteine O-methyltransferase Ste14